MASLEDRCGGAYDPDTSMPLAHGTRLGRHRVVDKPGADGLGEAMYAPEITGRSAAAVVEIGR